MFKFLTFSVLAAVSWAAPAPGLLGTPVLTAAAPSVSSSSSSVVHNTALVRAPVAAPAILSAGSLLTAPALTTSALAGHGLTIPALSGLGLATSGAVGHGLTTTALAGHGLALPAVTGLGLTAPALSGHGVSLSALSDHGLATVLAAPTLVASHGLTLPANLAGHGLLAAPVGLGVHGIH